jgi:hypothetical protein
MYGDMSVYIIDGLFKRDFSIKGRETFKCYMKSKNYACHLKRFIIKEKEYLNMTSQHNRLHLLSF